MTHPTQTVRGAEAVQTNGEGQRSAAHLNLTVTMQAWMDAELEGIRLASPQFYARRFAGSSK